MSTRLLTMAVALCLSTVAGAQQIRTFTETFTVPNALVYGLPVPLPIDSLTPVDGFRSYASLEARLQSLALESDDLAAHDIGRSSANRVQWAYVASDEDGVDVEGRPEAAFFVNATTHAREWAAPEVATGTLERLVAGADDRGIVRFLLDNTRTVVIPVHNIDGFLQTQRYPTQAIVGLDPDVPSDWPRDGRMRRKNMPGVDEVLTTFGDHLGGIDLNRNHPPLWATSVGNGGSSANPDSLTYHGAGPHSEAENLSLENAAELGPATRLRLGVDVHVYGKVFFASNTGRERLNTIQANLVERLRTHHRQVSDGSNYQHIPDPPNRGIGAAAEYFAYEWLVPAWTLELEPSSSALEYGGTSVTHSGFILPASEARRVREAWAETHLVAFYMMAGPAHLARVRFVEADTDRLAMQLRWRWNQATGLRVRETSGDGALQPGRRYRVELGFSKPMRYRNPEGVIVPIPGAAGISRAVNVTLTGAAGDIALDTSAGAWLEDEPSILRYRNDTFAFEFDAPANVAQFGLDVGTLDLVGLALDADPSTPTDWTEGAWSAYEDADGTAGDIGGVDGSTAFATSNTIAALADVASAPAIVGEGDVARIRLRRLGSTAGALYAHTDPIFGEGGVGAAGAQVRWAAGEGGEKELLVGVGENVEIDGDRQASLAIVVADTTAQQDRALAPVAVTVRDNDGSDLAVLRSRSHGLSMFDALSLATDAGGAEDDGREGAAAIVLDRDAEQVQTLPARGTGDVPPTTWLVSDPLSIYGNHADLMMPRDTSQAAVFRVDASGQLLIDAVNLGFSDPSGAGAHARGLLRNEGSSVIRRSVLGPGKVSGDAAIHNTGVLNLRRTAIISLDGAVQPAHSVATAAGSLTLDASTMIGPSLSSPPFPFGASLGWTGTSDGMLGGVTLANNLETPIIVLAETDIDIRAGHVLLQDNLQGLQISPPRVPPDAGWNCSWVPLQSLGFNLEDEIGCGFEMPTDRTFVPLELLPLLDDPAVLAPVGPAIDGGATVAQSAATGCGPVDQRGAPRPQTLVDGAEPRCDIGAIELGINPYRGIWAPERSGHGLDLQTSGNTLLIAWYTYADDGQPTAYQAAAPLTGRHWEATLQASRRDAQGVVTVVNVGRVSIDFVSDVEATLGWRFDARGVDGSETIRASLFADGTPRFEVTGLWFPPGEPNYGATITRRGETTALGLYYYDASGTIRWALGTADAADVVDLAMTSFTGFCPDCDPAQMPVVGAAAGRVQAHFRTPERARLDIELTYPGGAGGSWNRPQTPIVPLNDPVDNRAAAALVPER